AIRHVNSSVGRDFHVTVNAKATDGEDWNGRAERQTTVETQCARSGLRSVLRTVVHAVWITRGGRHRCMQRPAAERLVIDASRNTATRAGNPLIAVIEWRRVVSVGSETASPRQLRC